MSKFLLKSLSFLMTVLLCFSIFTFPVFAKTEADFDKEIEKLENQIATNKDKAEINDKNIEQKRQQINLQQEQLNIYNDKIAALSRQIFEKDKIIQQYQTEIKALLEQIDKNEKEQQKLETKISTTYELLGERLRSAYMAGETSDIEILMQSTSFQDFLTRMELLYRVSKHDSDMVSGLQKAITEYEEAKEQLQKDKVTAEEKQNTIVKEKSEIEAARAKEQSVRNVLNTKQNQLQNEADRLYAYQDKLDKNDSRLQAMLAQEEKEKEEYLAKKAAEMESGSGNLDVSGDSQFTKSSKGMIFPLQYPTAYINCGWMGYRGHKGIDMITRGATGNTYGKQIRAAADGVVTSAENHYSWGNNVYINHGNGVYTRYAHTSRMLVSPGQTVKQGQVIALVGNTGNVSPRPTAANPHAGAHLHFEVWVNGQRVNPTPWIPSGPDR